MTIPTALTIAGSDSGGGAGIQADLKTFFAHQTFGMSVITAITAQNTRGVSDIHIVPIPTILAQLHAIREDLPVGAIKIGMLGGAEVINAVADFLESWLDRPPIVLDPVMVAKGGAPLLPRDASALLVARLVPLATLLTPNLPEAIALGLGLRNGLLTKGGHHEGATVEDTLYWEGKEYRWSNPRIESKNTHGTGCTLAAAIAARLARGEGVVEACGGAIHYVQRLIEGARVSIGGGHGPLLHERSM